MEIRARYLLVGSFSLAVIAGALWFVYWLNNAGRLGAGAVYLVRFESPVAGLRPGSAVLFNGIRVGEVRRLQLDPEEPRRVTATISVQDGTPVRADTAVAVETQGLMGAPAITLRGGTREAPALAASEGQPGLLVADPSATEEVTQAARDTLQVIRKVVSENADPLHGAIENLSTFTGALARNSDRLDGIIEGLERMTAGGSGNKPLPVYDIALPREIPALKKPPQGQIAVPEPTALLVFDTQRILVRSPEGQMAPLENAQWADSLPKLVQAKVIQTFEAAGYQDAVSRPLDGGMADYQLVLEIRSFQVSAGADPEAVVEISAKLLAEGSKVLGSRTFRATAPVKAVEPASAVAGLAAAFREAAANLVTWVDETIQT